MVPVFLFSSCRGLDGNICVHLCSLRTSPFMTAILQGFNPLWYYGQYAHKGDMIDIHLPTDLQQHKMVAANGISKFQRLRVRHTDVG